MKVSFVCQEDHRSNKPVKLEPFLVTVVVVVVIALFSGVLADSVEYVNTGYICFLATLRGHGKVKAVCNGKSGNNDD